jgi:hypothetical protein
MSARLRPRSRASDDTDRGWPPSSVNKSLRNVIDMIGLDVTQHGEEAYVHAQGSGSLSMQH